MVNKIRQILIFILFIVTAEVNYGQVFKASVDNTVVSQYQQFQVYFEFKGGNINSLSAFRAPSFKGLNLLGGPNQSSSMQIINGKVSSSLTYSFILQAFNAGKYTIGSASVYYKGKKYTTKPITITVVKGKVKPKPKAKTAAGSQQEELAKSVFIRAIPNKRIVKQGEQVTIIYKLYTKLNMSSPSITKMPSFKGFWVVDLNTKQTINFQIEMYNGERIRAAVIKKVALFPTKSGKFTITPFELNVPVLVRRRRTGNNVFNNFFNDPFFSQPQTINYLAKSNPVNIKVEPLPSKNVPSSFKGAVGKFNLTSSIDKKQVKVNGTLNLKLTISGTGNIQLIDMPDLNLPPGLEKYEPKTTVSIKKQNIVSGNKTVDYLIVPRTLGDKIIPSVKFTYYDIYQNKYVTLYTPEYKIKVLKGKAAYVSAAPGFSKETVKLLSEDIRFIKTSSFKLVKKSSFSTFPVWFWYFIIIPFILLLTLLVIKKRKDKLAGNIQLMRYQKAEKAAKLKLKKAKQALSEDDSVKFHNEISKALFGYLGDKLNLQVSEFTLERAVTELGKRNVNDALIKKVKSIAEECEFARFAPQNNTAKTNKNLFDETVKLIVEIENNVKLRNKK